MPYNYPHFNYPVPMYSDWLTGTPVIPKFYWDVKSPEQRIKYMCCELAKITAYLDNLVDILNEKIDTINDETNEITAIVEELRPAIAEVTQAVSGIQDEIAQVEANRLAITAETARADATFVKRAGDTMTGQLKTIAPVADNDAANKKYVDEYVDEYLVDDQHLADGSVTLSKLATGTIDGILSGLTIRFFDTDNPAADNDGATAAGYGNFNGFYIEELCILFIQYLSFAFKSPGTLSTAVKLPAYIPKVTPYNYSVPNSYLKCCIPKFYSHGDNPTSPRTESEFLFLGIVGNDGVNANNLITFQGGPSSSQELTFQDYILKGAGLTFYLRPFLVGDPVQSNSSYTDNADPYFLS